MHGAQRHQTAQSVLGCQRPTDTAPKPATGSDGRTNTHRGGLAPASRPFAQVQSELRNRLEPHDRNGEEASVETDLSV